MSPSSASAARTSVTPSAPEAAGYAVATESVDLQATNKVYMNLEKETGAPNGSSNVGNIYDTIDSVPIASSQSPPGAAAAAAGLSVNIHPINSDYDVPTSYMSMSPTRSTALPPSPSPASAAAAAAAASTYSVIRDDFDDLAETAAIDQRPDNSSPAAAAASSRSDIYDSIDDTYQNVTASAPEPTALVSDEAASCTEDAANQVYLQPDNAVNDVPCCYEMTLNVEPSGDVYANCQQELDVGESTA